jgi:uncharacterized protein (DUF169 family)
MMHTHHAGQLPMWVVELANYIAASFQASPLSSDDVQPNHSPTSCRPSNMNHVIQMVAYEHGVRICGKSMQTMASI